MANLNINFFPSASIFRKSVFSDVVAVFLAFAYFFLMVVNVNIILLGASAIVCIVCACICLPLVHSLFLQ